MPNSPNRNGQNQQVYELERYDLIVSGAFPNGDTGNNIAGTITGAQYIQYSNNTKELRLVFNNNLPYVYHLSNPRSKIETSAGVFRETYTTEVQAGKDFLFGQYFSELYYKNDTITSISIIERNRVIALLNFSKKL
jgi:hypothetical protein